MLPYEVKLVITANAISNLTFHEVYLSIIKWCQSRWPQTTHRGETWQLIESSVRSYRDGNNAFVEEQNITFRFLYQEDAMLFKLTWND